MATNRKWMHPSEKHTLRSSDGSIWLCKVCGHIAPYDEELDGKEARKNQMHKYPRHHYVYAIQLHNEVPVDVPGIYNVDGVRQITEAEAIRLYRERLVERFIIPEAKWEDRALFGSRYIDQNVSVTFYQCMKCNKVTPCNPQDIRRVIHCEQVARSFNTNFKMEVERLLGEDS